MLYQRNAALSGGLQHGRAGAGVLRRSHLAAPLQGLKEGLHSLMPKVSAIRTSLDAKDLIDRAEVHTCSRQQDHPEPAPNAYCTRQGTKHQKSADNDPCDTIPRRKIS